MNSDDKKDKSSAMHKGLCRFLHASLYMCWKHIYHTYGTEEKFEEAYFDVVDCINSNRCPYARYL